jgi:hypothetical protein
MDVQHIEMTKGLDQATQPEWFVPTAQKRDPGDHIARSPNAAGAVRQLVEMLGGSGKAKHGHCNTIA